MRVVVMSPRFNACLGVVERQELMDVKALVTQAPVKRFDVPFVGLLAWSHETERHTAIECPRSCRFQCELHAVIHGDGFRQLARPDAVFKCPGELPRLRAGFNL